jgi:membrane protein YqaA with SNARE-associated domain
MGPGSRALLCELHGPACCALGRDDSGERRALGGHSRFVPLSNAAMLKKLYEWCVTSAGKPHATWVLGGVSFAESSFFPVPPDAMLIPMAMARPDKAYSLALVCTVASVVGGLLGYFIGAALYDTVGLWLIQLYGYGSKVEAFREAYAQWGALIILGKGFTPIPYKIVTITSGFAAYPLLPFVVFSLITRGARFYLEAFLCRRYGDRARAIIEKRLAFWFTIAMVVVVVGIVAVLYLF